MGRLLLVHGIDNTYGGAEQMSAEWLPALMDGVGLAGGAIAPGDVACVFYGDLFRPAGRFLGNASPEPEDDIEEGPELDLLLAWWEAAAKVDPAVVPPAARTLGARATARAALLALSGSKILAGASERAIAWRIKQVTAYFGNPEIRSAVQTRFREKLTPGTRVVVAHSLGSVVAYEGLCHAEHGVSDLVTLGSPLGVRHLVFDRLLWQGVWPGVDRWVNITDRNDFVALQPVLRNLFGERVVDVEIDNGASAHRVQRYLSAAETGAAVLAGNLHDRP